MRIAYRVQLAALVPMVGMLLAFGTVIAGKQRAVGEVEHMRDLTGLAVSVGDLVHDLQRERGASTVHALSQGGNHAMLAAWRADTARAKARFEAAARAFAPAAQDAKVAAALAAARA